ncbi:MAG: polymer-forming cytoskeletal protein [Spirochaetales bacterium]|nr:polymer-forming cytoskeletal protein [Spirochaetales bacterium]
MPRRNDQVAIKARTVLGGETKFDGVLKFHDSLKIEGKFEGAIESSGALIVHTGAQVVADVRVGTLVVAGTIHGDVVATERLELLPGGQVIGNIRCPRLKMAEGSGVQGRCEMLADPVGIDIFSMPLDRLKKSLARVQ